ncbi:hypothetical protein L1887_31479 [Cichorium endivia]|nr:hypothetical protein L1887_31479 [Cichorium endivia]
MSSDHQETSGFKPPSTLEELHSQPPSSTTGDNPSDSTRLRHPHTPSLMAPTTETNAPESPIAATPGVAFFTTPPTSFDAAASATTSAVNTHNPIPQTLTITTKPPNVSEPPRRTTILRRPHFYPSKTDSKEPQNNKKPPQQLSSTPKSRTSRPGFSTIKRIPQSKLQKPEDKVREFRQRFWDVIRQVQDHAENHNPPEV